MERNEDATLGELLEFHRFQQHAIDAACGGGGGCSGGDGGGCVCSGGDGGG